MQRHTLYAYVDGSDLEDVAASIEERLVELAIGPGWVTSRPTVVNQKKELSGSHPDDLPDWDLGINLALPDPGDEPEGWFGDVERVAGYLAKLHSTFAREFVIGIADNVTGAPRISSLSSPMRRTLAGCGAPSVFAAASISALRPEAGIAVCYLD